MHFSLYKFGDKTTLHLGKRRVRGLAIHTAGWRKRQTREALTGLVSFLPLTNLNWVSLNATLLSAPTFL